MPASKFIPQASKFRTIISNADNSEILAYADELFLFLNRLRDFIRHNLKAKTSTLSIDDIIYRLESNP